LKGKNRFPTGSLSPKKHTYSEQQTNRTMGDRWGGGIRKVVQGEQTKIRGFKNRTKKKQNLGKTGEKTTLDRFMMGEGRFCSPKGPGQSERQEYKNR